MIGMVFVLSLFGVAAGPTTEQQIGALALIVLTFVIAYVFTRRWKK
jgi:4-hydroxybenzoate polyprenyltransferase